MEKQEREQLISTHIEDAWKWAGAGKAELATQSFSLARSMACQLIPKDELETIVENDLATFVKEREHYRALLRRDVPESRGIVVLADSLGLPRPNDIDGPMDGAERTYSGLYREKYSDRSFDSICQRFLTTDAIIKILHEEPNLGVESDVVIHVGLNDCSARMFLDHERLSLSVLPAALRTRMVDFTRKFRRNILQTLPAKHYVPPEKFFSNLNLILDILLARGALQVIFTTIILPPARSWPGTPGMNKNFARYNLMIMEVASLPGASLHDFDRQVWWHSASQPLLDDGMHLSDEGHRLFANNALPP